MLYGLSGQRIVNCLLVSVVNCREQLIYRQLTRDHYSGASPRVCGMHAGWDGEQGDTGLPLVSLAASRLVSCHR